MSSIDQPFHRKIPDIWPKCTVHAYNARLHPGCTASLCRHRSVRNRPWHLPRASAHLALQLRLAMQQGSEKKRKKTTQNQDTKHGKITKEREGRTERKAIFTPILTLYYPLFISSKFIGRQGAATSCRRSTRSISTIRYFSTMCVCSCMC
jgi:hypothetical protein